MRRRLAVLTFGVLLVGACNDGGDAFDGATAPEAEVLAAWDTYQEAVLAADGADAAEVLSEPTIDYCGELAELARTATRGELDERPLLDVATVLIARFEYSADSLADMNGRAFLEASIRDGLIDESTVAGMAFDEAFIAGDTAELTTSNPRQALQRLDMRNEDGRWKVHLVALMREFGRRLDRSLAGDGSSPTDAALEFMRATRPTADESLFDPPQ